MVRYTNVASAAVVAAAVFAMLALVVQAAPAPQSAEPEVKLVRYVNDNSGIDGYHFT